MSTTTSIESPPRRWAELRAGFAAVLPIWLGAAPFGVIYAVGALAAGLSPAQTLAMSLLVFAGASQFSAVGMFAAGAAGWPVVIATLVINARHLIMAASLAPHLRRVGRPARLLLAAQLTDESYAVGIRQFLEGRGSPGFLAGANLSIYLVWQASTLAGIGLGQAIPNPAAYGLDLVFPLTFVGLLAPLLRTRGGRAAAALAAPIALAGAAFLPGTWHILLAGLVASGLAAWATRRAP